MADGEDSLGTRRVSSSTTSTLESRPIWEDPDYHRLVGPPPVDPEDPSKLSDPDRTDDAPKD